MKRVFLFLMSVVLLACTLYFPAVASYEDYVEPIIGIKTQIEAVEWIASFENEYCNYDGVSGAQCVDLIKAYYAFHGKEVLTGNANHYIYDSYSGCKVPEGWVRIQYYPGFVAQAGDIALFDHGTYGHIGLIVGADEAAMTTIENNRNNSLGTDNALKGTRKYTDMSFWGVIRPSFYTYYRGVTYTLGHNGEYYMAVDFDNSISDVMILSTCNGLPVTRIYQIAFSARDRLTSLTIPSTVTTIDWRSIAHCKNLRTVHLPNSVTYIGECAFFDSPKLKSILIPHSVISIGELAFHECKNLKIYCEANEKPSGWSGSWEGVVKVYWGYNKDSASNRFVTLTTQISGLQSSNYDDDQWINIQVAQAFAEEYDVENSSLDDLYSVNDALEEIINGKSLIKGDIDRNDSIDQFDYLMLKRAFFGTYKLLAGDMLRADIDEDDNITEYDYLLLKRIYSGTYTLK